MQGLQDFICLDLETTGLNPKRDRIIEIGAVKLNEEYEIIDEFSQLIKPQIYHTMHKITADLIHLQMKELRKGKDFFLCCCSKACLRELWARREYIP